MCLQKLKKMDTMFEISTLTNERIDNLLALQQQNLKNNLDVVTQQSQGYLSFSYTTAIMQRMMHAEPQPIAYANGQIIGYALATPLKVCQTIDLMLPLLNMFNQLIYNGKPLSDYQYYVMGQVCVHAGYRSIGVFDALYAKHRTLFADRYDFVVTEIAADNLRSIAAHQRVGFQTLHRYFDALSQKTWVVVIWDFATGLN
jgi:ribosomal protein S18 acetylase RimI-like enzyme